MNEDSGEIEDIVNADDILVTGQCSHDEFTIDIKSDYKSCDIHEYFDIPEFNYAAKKEPIPTIVYTKSGKYLEIN